MTMQQPVPDKNLLLMCLLALLAGIVGGVGAWLFRMLIGLVHNTLFLGIPAFQYDATLHTPAGPWGIGIIAVPVLGGLVVVWLVKTFAPEARGHGVPEVMDAIYYRDGYIRPRVAIIKSLASAISIGSGAAVGREGPIIQIGSAFGSMLGQIVAMPARQRIVLIAAGSGAGIAATFNAPLGGIVFAMELLLVSVSATNVLLVGIATVTATHIGRLLLGTSPSFDIPQLAVSSTHLHPALLLGLLALLGILMGLVSVIFIRGLYWAEDRFNALPGNDYSRHALGMLCVGIMMYLLMQQAGHYYIQGVGYATIVDILTGILSDPGFLLLLFALKLAATCLSLGSGASGGVFSPALFLGATIGAACGQLLIQFFPELNIPIPAFAIAGMAAAIGGSTGAVLTGIIMLTEMTADQSVIMPLIIVVISAAAVRRLVMKGSIYTMKLRRRGKGVPEGLQAAITSTTRIGDLMRTDVQLVATVDPAMPDAWVLCADNSVTTPHTSVPDSDAPATWKYILAQKEDGLADTLRRMQDAGAQVVLVTEDSSAVSAQKVIGVLGQQEIARHTETLATLL